MEQQVNCSPAGTYPLMESSHTPKHRTRFSRMTAFLAVLLFALPLAQAQSDSADPETAKGDDIEGHWLVPDGATVKIFQKDGKFFGQVVKGNDDAQTQKLEAAGFPVLLRDFEKDNGDGYCCGTIYNPQKKKTIKGTLYLEDEDTLRVEGKMGMFRGSKTWTRVQ